MSNFIRTSFVGSSASEENFSSDDSKNANNIIMEPSPTSALDFHNALSSPSASPPVKASSSNFRTGRQMIKDHTARILKEHAPNNSNRRHSEFASKDTTTGDTSLMINQLKRQVTALEHEKASLEQELLNQINTVVGDKETMVSTLQEKLVASEERYKQEKQAHAELRASMRQGRASSSGDAKVEVSRLQDLVLELKQDKEKLQQQIATLKQHMQSSEEALLMQSKNMEQEHQAQLEEFQMNHSSKLQELEQSHAAIIADMERDLFERYQQKLQQVEEKYEQQLVEEKDKLSRENERNNHDVHLINQEMMASLQDANNQLLQQVSELSSELLEEQNNRLDLQSSLQQVSAIDHQEAVATLKEKVATLESKESTLRASLEQQVQVNRKLQQSLEESKDQHQEEHCRYEKELRLLDQQLDQEKATVFALEKVFEANKAEQESILQDQQKYLQQQHEDAATIEKLKTECGEYKQEIAITQQHLEDQKIKTAAFASAYASQQEDAAIILRLRTENTSFLEQVKSLQTTVDNQTQSNTSLQASLAESKARQKTLESRQQEDAAIVSKLHIECNRYAEENNTIKSQLEENIQKCSELQHTLEAVEKSHSKIALLEEGKESTEQSLLVLRQENDELKDSFESLSHAHAELTLKEQQTSEALVTIRAENEVMALEISDLRANLADQEGLNEGFEASIKNLEVEIKDLLATQQNNEEWIASLQEETEQLRSENEELSQQLEDARALNLSTKELEQEVSELKTLVDTKEAVISALEDRNEDLQDQVSQEQNTISTLLSSLDEEENTNSVLHEKHMSTSEEISNLKSSLQKEKAAVVMMKASLAKEESANSALLAAKEEKDDEVGRLQQENSSLVDRIDSMVQQLVDEQEMIQSFQTSLKEKDAALVVLEHAEKRKDEELLSLQTNLTELRAEVQVFRDCLSQEKASSADLKASIEAQQGTIEELRTFQSDATRSSADFERDRVSLLDRIGALKDELEKSLIANKSLQGSLEESQRILSENKACQDQKDDKNLALEKEIALLRDKSRQLRSQNQKLNSLVNILKASLLGSHRVCRRLEQEQDSLTERIRLQSVQIEASSASDEKLKSLLEDANSTHKEIRIEMEEQIESLKEENLSFRSQLDSQANDTSRLHSQTQVIVSAQEKNAALSEELESLRTQLKEHQEKTTTFDDTNASPLTDNTDVCGTDMESGERESCGTSESEVQNDSKDLESVERESCGAPDPEEQRDSKHLESCDRESCGTPDPEEQRDSKHLESGERESCGTQDPETQRDSKHLESGERESCGTSESEEQGDMAFLGEWRKTRGNADDSMNDDPDEKFDLLYLKTTVESLQEENKVLRKGLDSHLETQRAVEDLQAEKRLQLDEIQKLQNQIHEKEVAQSDSKPSLEEQQMASIVAALEDQTEKDDAIVELNEERERLRDEIEHLREQLREAQMASQSPVHSPFKALSDLADRLREMDENASAENESSGLNSSTESMAISQSTTPTKNGIEVEIDGGIILDLKDRDQKATLKDLRRLESELESERATREKLENANLAQIESIEALESDLSKAEEKIAGLEGKLSELQNIPGDNSEESAETIEITKKELDNTKVWLEKSLDEVEELRSKLLQSNSLLEDAVRENEDYRIQVERLESDLFEARQSLAIHLDEIERLQDCDADKEAQTEESFKVIESFKSAAEHWRSEADRFKAAKDEAVAKQMERESKLKMAYTKEVGGYKQRVEEFESVLLEENQKLRAQLESRNQSNTDDTEQVKKMSGELAELRIQIASGKKNTAELEKEKRKLNGELASVTKKLNEAQKLSNDLATAKQKVQDIEKEKDALRIKLEDFEADKMEKMLLEIDEQKEINKVKSALTAERKKVVECTEEIKCLRAASEALQRKCQDALSQAEAARASALKADEVRQSEQKRTAKSKDHLNAEMEDMRTELRRLQTSKVESEAQYREKLCTLEHKHTLVLNELEAKKQEIGSMRSFFGGDEDSMRSREDLQIEIKELTEKTVVQSRIIHTMQKKIELLEQGKEKFFEAKRREIMRDHSEQQSLRKENTRLREKVRDVTNERKALQAQLESFATSLGTSMARVAKKR